MANKLAGDERCNNVIRDENDKGARCSNTVTHALYNGSQVQSKVCADCAVKVAGETKFLKARPLH